MFKKLEETSPQASLDLDSADIGAYVRSVYLLSYQRCAIHLL